MTTDSPDTDQIYSEAAIEVAKRAAESYQQQISHLTENNPQFSAAMKMAKAVSESYNQLNISAKYPQFTSLAKRLNELNFSGYNPYNEEFSKRIKSITGNVHRLSLPKDPNSYLGPSILSEEDSIEHEDESSFVAALPKPSNQTPSEDIQSSDSGVADLPKLYWGHFTLVSLILIPCSVLGTITGIVSLIIAL